MKSISIFLLTSLVLSCNYPKDQAAIYNALEFTLDSLIAQKFGDNYSIGNMFSVALDENYIREDLEGIEEDLSSNDFQIEDLINQNNAFRGESIDRYINDTYHSKIKQEKGNSTHITIGVPLFNKDKTAFIHYILFDYDNDSWSHQYIECSLIQGQWKLSAVMEIVRDEIEVAIDKE